MYFISRVFIAALLIQSSLSLSFAMEITARECSTGVCTFNVLSDHQISSPCRGYSVIVAYGEASGTTMIQCSSPTDESKILLYNRNGNNRKGYELHGGRFFISESLPTLAAEGVPDQFGPKPLCNKQKPSPWGELIIGEKTVSKSGDPPYCYLINRITASGDELRIVTEDGRKVRPLSEAQVKRWAKLRALLSQYIPNNAVPNSKAGAPAYRKAVVKSTKAPLYSSSTSAAKTAKYLVTGDEVTILENSNDQAWTKIQYRTKTGKFIEMWLEARDLK